MIRFRVTGLVFLLLGLGVPSGAEQVAVNPKVVEVAKWDGWGCSLAWWGVFSNKWSPAQRQELCRHLFSRDKDALGLNVCRYNAGGTSPNADRSKFRLGGAVSVLLDQDGTWHPDRDHAQLACMQLAKRYGANRFELFANTPPYWLLRNGDTRGGDGGKENLKPNAERAFADWLLTTTDRLQQTTGVRFDYVSPFNEPAAWWWNPASSNQEGCAFPASAQANALYAFQEAMQTRKPGYRITASDENGAQDSYRTLDFLTRTAPINAKPTVQLFTKLNVHAYNGWDWQERLRDLAAQRGVPELWMSEVTYREWEDAGFIPDDMRCALPITRSVVSDIKHLHCSAWVFWQPIEPLEYCLRYHYTYGLLPTSVESSAEWNGKTYRPGEYVTTKSFSALRQFTAFIRPEDKLIASGDDWTLAALSPNGRKLTLVVHNDTKTDKPYSFDLSRFAQTGAKVQVWRTCDNANGEVYNCRSLPSLSLRDRRFADTIPGRSVTTYVLDNMRP